MLIEHFYISTVDIVEWGGNSRAVFKGKGMFQTLLSLRLLTGFEVMYLNVQIKY